MKHFILIFILSVSAGARADETVDKSDCMGLEIHVNIYQKWRQSFRDLMADFDGLSAEVKVERLNGASEITKIARDIEASIKGLKAPADHLKENEDLRKSFARDKTDAVVVIRLLKSNLQQIEERMQNMIYEANTKFPACNVKPGMYQTASPSPAVIR